MPRKGKANQAKNETQVDGVVTQENSDGSLKVELNDGTPAEVPAEASVAEGKVVDETKSVGDALAGDAEVTPEAKLKAKHIQEEIDRKKKTVTLSEYILIVRDARSEKKGGKVRHCIVKGYKHKGGVLKQSTHSLYLGREKQLVDVIEKFKKKGVEVRIA